MTRVVCDVRSQRRIPGARVCYGRTPSMATAAEELKVGRVPNSKDLIRRSDGSAEWRLIVDGF